MVKKIPTSALFISTLFSSYPLLAGTHPVIPTYDALLQTLSQGDEVRAILRLDKCQARKKRMLKGATTGGLNFSVFNHYTLPHKNNPKEIIATSTHMFVESQQYGPVYNYVRLRVFKNNTAEVYSEFQDPKSFSSLHRNTFTCELSNNSQESKGITLYNLS